jgi:hypothetical protein
MVSAGLLARSISWMSWGIVQPTPRSENRIGRVIDKTSPWKGVSEYAVLNFGLEAGQITSAQKDVFFDYNDIELLDFSTLNKKRVLEALSMIEENGGLPDQAKFIVLNQTLNNDTDILERIDILVNQHNSISRLSIRYTNALLTPEPALETQASPVAEADSQETPSEAVIFTLEPNRTSASSTIISPINTEVRVNTSSAQNPNADVNNVVEQNTHAGLSVETSKISAASVQNLDYLPASTTIGEEKRQNPYTEVSTTNPMDAIATTNIQASLKSESMIAKSAFIASNTPLSTQTPVSRSIQIGQASPIVPQVMTEALPPISSETSLGNLEHSKSSSNVDTQTKIDPNQAISLVTPQSSNTDISHISDLETTINFPSVPNVNTIVGLSNNPSIYTNARLGNQTPTSSSSINQFIKLVDSNQGIFSNESLAALTTLIVLSNLNTPTTATSEEPIWLSPTVSRNNNQQTN